MEYLYIAYQLFMVVTAVLSTGDGTLVARDVLKTIAPIGQHVQLPPGFPTVNTISTEKFRYKASGSKIEVSANLDETITMFPGHVTITNIKLNFSYDKKKKSDWTARARGTWEFGSSTLDVEILSNGTFTSFVKSIKFTDITKKFLKNNTKDIGIETSALSLTNVQIKGEISRSMDRLEINFHGTLALRKLSPIPVDITVAKQSESSPMQVFTVLEFKNISPEKVLRELLNQKTLRIPFFAHLLMSSDLFSSKKNVFGVAFSYNEIYYYKRMGVVSDILADVLQSHIPEGITLLFPINVKQGKKNKKKKNNQRGKKRDKNNNNNPVVSDAVNIAFVLNNPVFDLLISQQNKISATDILPVLSKELSVSSKDVLPNFAKDLDDAYTTHVSFDWTTTDFTVFIRLQETVNLIPDLLSIKVSNLILQKKMMPLKNNNNNSNNNSSNKESWKISAKGNFTIGNATFEVQYSQIDKTTLSSESGKIFGLTGSANKMSLDDIIDEFDPEFYPDREVKDMIENTELSTLELYDVKLYSRVQNQGGTPHLLLIGYTNLPQWEKNIQVAILIFRRNGSWECKWAISLKHSPLSSVVEALTGFDSGEIELLHNSHIMTTLISSPAPSMTKLPPHIITTPLLRLPVEKGLDIIALIRFPDNCGDDKMCEAASSVLDTGKLYTAKGKLSTKEFKIHSNVTDDIQFSDHLKGINNTLEFTIGNSSRMDVLTTIRMPRTPLIFDGPVHIYKTGGIQLQMTSRLKRWLSPFALRTISFKDLSFVANYENGQSVQKLDFKGTVLLGLQGNGAEITAPVRILYNPGTPFLSTFYSNFTEIKLARLLEAFTLDVQLPSILEDSSFPNGLMLTYSGRQELSASNDYSLHGDLNIFGRLLYCSVSTKHSGYLKIVTENSPAPVIFARGLIIVLQSEKAKLRGPKIIAEISHRGAKVLMEGYVKLLGIESEVEMDLKDTGIEFTVTGKIMDYKQTRLTAYSTNSPESFHVSGCIEDVAVEVQFLLVETILKSANQSVINMKKAEDNYLNAQRFFLLAVREEDLMRKKRDRARIAFEDALIEYGKYVVKTNEVCPVRQCGYIRPRKISIDVKTLRRIQGAANSKECFGCPKLNRCCRLDIFGHCIACPSWKQCCWKNIDPLCIAKQDGCHVIKAQAEKELAAKEARIVQQRIILDNLEQFLTKAEIEKGKHRAVLEAAIDAKQIVEEDSTPGLNAHDAIREYGAPYGWAKVNNVCYDTTVVQAATGCMQFLLNIEFFDRGVQKVSIWSCLKEDLVTELTESLANYMFPNMVDTSSDSITEVAARLNEAESEIQNEITDDDHQTPVSLTGKRPGVSSPGLISLGNYTATGTFPKYNNTLVENMEFDMIPANNTANTPQYGKVQSVGPVQAGNLQDIVQTDEEGSTIAINTNNAQTQGVTNTTTSQSNHGPNRVEKISSDEAGDQLFPVKNPINIKDTDKGNNGKRNGSNSTMVEKIPTDKAGAELYPVKNPINIKDKNKSSSQNVENGADIDVEFEVVGSASEEEESSTSGEFYPVSGEREESSAVAADNNQDGGSSAENGPISYSGEDNVPDKVLTERPYKQSIVNKTQGSAMQRVDEEYSGDDDEDGDLSTDDSQNEVVAEETVNKAVNNNNSNNSNSSNNNSYSNSSNNRNSNNNSSNNNSSSSNSNSNTSNNNSNTSNNNNSKSSSNNSRLKLVEKYNSGNSSNHNNNNTHEDPRYNTTNIYPYVYPIPYTKQLQQHQKNQLSSQNVTLNYKNTYPQYYSALQSWYNSQRGMFKSNTSKQVLPYAYPSKSQGTGKSKTRRRRSIDEVLHSDARLEENKGLLHSDPFWDIHTDHNTFQARYNIPNTNRHQILRGMIQKRWSIPENPGGRCRIFHQLIAICKDMAETILTLDKSLKQAQTNYEEEDKNVYLELFETEESLVAATKRVNVSGIVAMEAAKTLGVVREGVNIWSKRCSNEFEWQRQTGVYAWLQSMDLRIQELGGYGVFRFLDNLFNAFQALFEHGDVDSGTLADNYAIIEKTRQISEAFRKVFKSKLDVTTSRAFADNILGDLEQLKKANIPFCH